MNASEDEVDEIYREFLLLLAGPTEDGQIKRAVHAKPNWKVDSGHEAALVRHWDRYWGGQLEDEDSGCHVLVHVAWRALALAWIDIHKDEVW